MGYESIEDEVVVLEGANVQELYRLGGSDVIDVGDFDGGEIGINETVSHF